MAISSSHLEINLENPAERWSLLKSLREQWENLHDTPGVFRYKLSVKEEKILPGEFKFYCQFNPDRPRCRRKPQQIQKVRPPFDGSVFNFRQARPEETIAKIKWKGSEYSLLINQSPLTPLHTLIIPRIEDHLPQILSFELLDFSLHFLASLGDKDYRIGYNSPGAMASVNHLHAHLIYVDRDLFLDNAVRPLEEFTNSILIPISLQPLIPIANGFYRIDCPVKAFCLVLSPTTEAEEFAQEEVLKIYKLVTFFCDENIPHNLFITPQRSDEGCSIRVFVFVREKYFTVKDLLELNMGFCELGGYFAVGDKILFDGLTEDLIVDKMKREIGDNFSVLEKRIAEILE